MYRFYLTAALALGICCGTLGCGKAQPGNVSKVEGKVTYDGQPIPDALVTFKPKNSGTNSFGRTDESGHYSLVYGSESEGAEIGEHDVTISNQPFPGSAKPAVVLPRKFGQTGRLTANVTAGESNEIDFDIKSK